MIAAARKCTSAVQSVPVSCRAQGAPEISLKFAIFHNFKHSCTLRLGASLRVAALDLVHEVHANSVLSNLSDPSRHSLKSISYL